MLLGLFGTLLSLVVGAISGVIAGVLFEHPLKERLDRIRRWHLRRSGRRLGFHPPDTPVDYKDAFCFGPLLQTSIYIVEGNGESFIDEDNVAIHVDPTPVVLPDELLPFRHAIEQREAEKRRRGEQYFWNGLNFAVHAFALTRTGMTEESEVRITLRPSDYYNFRTVQESLDEVIPSLGETVRQHYLHPFYWNHPQAFLSSSFGVNVALITADGALLVTQRSDIVGSRPLEYSLSANEGLSRGVDDAGSNPPDLYNCAYRALQEELGIVKSDLRPVKSEGERYQILAFFVDLHYNQWGCLGVAYLKTLTSAQVTERRVRASKDRFEHIAFEFVTFDPESVVRFVLDPQRRAHWNPAAPTCFYLALVAAFGRGAVDRALERVSRAYVHAAP